jgi:hypothetical protein
MAKRLQFEGGVKVGIKCDGEAGKFEMVNGDAGLKMIKYIQYIA